MRYLIVTNNDKPALTKWFEPDDHFVENVGMIVYDLIDRIYTTDGLDWEDIDIDYL